MAFVFVPPFNEGGKQTNPDTGVEYIYSDGAWRALGPAIEDEFDTLDDRYVKLEGTTILGDYYRLRAPGTGAGTSTFQVIDEGTQKLYNLATPQDSNTAWAAPVGYVQSYVQGQIDAIPDVNLDGYATEDYVDQSIAGYLPLTGGDLTGVLNIDRPGNPALVISQNGTDNLKLWADGTVTTTKTDFGPSAFVTREYVDNVTLTGDYLPLSGGTLSGTLTGQLFKSVRSGNVYAFEVKPGDTSTKAFIRTDGTSRLATLTIESPMASGAERAFEIKGRLADGSTVSKDFFYMYANNDGTPSAMNYKGKMDNEFNLVNKGYVDSKFDGISGGKFYVSSGSLYFEID